MEYLKPYDQTNSVPQTFSNQIQSPCIMFVWMPAQYGLFFITSLSLKHSARTVWHDNSFMGLVKLFGLFNPLIQPCLLDCPSHLPPVYLGVYERNEELCILFFVYLLKNNGQMDLHVLFSYLFIRK